MNTDDQGDIGLYSVGAVISKEFKWIFRPQPFRDKGIDAHIEINSQNYNGTGLIALQIKSGLSYFKEKNEKSYIFREDFRVLDYWLSYPIPVIIMLHHPDETIYWQIINEKNISRLDKGWKIEVPFKNTLTINNKENISNHCRFYINKKNYSILETQDVSHGLAKRYALKVLLNNKLSKNEIQELIIYLTEIQKSSEYYRSDLVRKVWSGKEASVVWIYVYSSYEDSKRNNWICMSQWISSSLNSNASPGQISGTKINNELVIEWSKNYEYFSEIYLNEINKEDYLLISNQIIDLANICLNRIDSIFNEYSNDKISEEKFSKKIKKLIIKIEELNTLQHKIDLPSLECLEFHEYLLNYICNIDNIKIVFNTQQSGRNSISNRDYLIEMYINSAKQEYVKLNYELKKITN